MKAIILAAGKSTRTYPLTLTRPKPLLPLWGKPIIAHTLAALSKAGVDEAVVVVGYRGEIIRGFLGETYAGVKLVYVEQAEMRGTADAVGRARGCIEGDVVIIGGDDYFGERNLTALAHADAGAILGAPVRDVGSFGLIVSNNGRLEAILEKSRDAGAGLANTGAYKVNAAIFGYIEKATPSARGELEFTDALTAYAADLPVAVVKTAGPWVPIANATDLLACQLFLWPSREQVIPGFGCSVDGEAAVGGRSVLGQNCRVGANAVVEGSLLLDGITVGDGASVTGCILGEGVLVGPYSFLDGAVVGDGAAVGEYVVLEAGTRVWPGVKIDDGLYAGGEVRE